jgi:V/A-type H+-transporting ATPase subunit E
MSAEGLKKAVLEAARGEAEGIIVRARADAESGLKQATELAEREAAAHLEQARLQAEQERRQALAARERENRLETLQAKNRLLEQAFTRAAEAFRALPMDGLKELYRRELAAVDLQDATVRVPRNTKADFEALTDKRCRVEEDPALEAGYIVERRDFRLDRSLAARLQEIRSELRPRVAGLLFGTEE